MTDIKALVERQFTDAARLSKKYVHPRLVGMFEMAGMKVLFTRGQGQYLWDGDGHRFLDLLAGGGVHFVGRNHPQIQAAVAEVAGMQLPNITNVNPSLLGGVLAERLIKLAGEHYGKVFFTNSGTECTDLGIRFARYVTRRRRFLHLEGGFHGRTYAAISNCGFPEMREGMAPLLQTCTPVRPNDISQVRRELRYGDVAGFLLEPVQGMTGEVLEESYLREVEALCRQHGTLLIADEVQTGLGRTGSWFRTQAVGVHPSILSVSKTLSGGLVPVGAILIGEDVYDTVFKQFKSGPFYWSTFAENNLAMAAGLATLDVLEEMNAPVEAARKAALLEEGIAQLARRYDCIERMTGKGLLQCVYFKESDHPKLRAEQKLLALGDKGAFGAAVHVDMYRDYRVILQIPGPGLNAIKMVPPVCITEEDIAYFLQSLDETLGRYYQAQGPALKLGQAVLGHVVDNAKERLSALGRGGQGEGSRKPGNGSLELADKKKRAPLVLLGPDAADLVAPSHTPPGESLRATPKHGTNGRLPRLPLNLEAYDSDRFFEFSDYRGPLVERCEFLVVGGGPAGTMAAKRLAEGGRNVILLEAGRRLTPDDFGFDGLVTAAKHFWDGGIRPTRGNTFVASLRVRALGGGSVFNSAICMRASETAVDRWREENGIGFSYQDLVPHYEHVESFLQVAPSDESIMGRRNLLFRDGARKLGYRVEPLPRLTPHCRGAGECFTGCRFVGAKHSMDVRGIPEMMQAGGRVYTSIHVDRLIIRDGRCLGIEGHTVEPRTGKRGDTVRILADCTILAAGVFASPVIAQRGGLTRNVIGGNLRLHPAAHAVGIYDEPVRPWEGASQGYHCLEFMRYGIKIEDVWASPGIFARLYPSVAEEFAEYFKDFDKLGVIGTWVSGDDSVGRVQALPGGLADYRYDLGEADVRRFQTAMVHVVEIFLASGAREVLARFGAKNPSLRSLEDVRALRDAHIDIDDITVTSNHVFGSLSMGGNPETSAVDSWGKVWDAEHLYVCDTSVFPSSPQANPMLPAMAFADRQAVELLKRY